MAATEELVEIVRIEVPEVPGVSGTVSGLSEVVMPLGVPPVTAAASDTVPAKPVLLREIVDVADLPAARPMLAGFTVIV